MKPKTNVRIILVAAVCIGALSFLLPASPEYGNTPSYYSKTFLGVVCVLSTLYFGAAVLLLRGLSAFKSRLRKAYGLLCAGYILFAVAQLQLPIVQIFKERLQAWVSSSNELILYLLALFFIYAGLRRFARIFNIKSVWMSWPFVVAASLGLAVLTSFLPHVAPVTTKDVQFRATIGLIGLGEVLATSNLVLTIKTKRAANIIYSNALAWLIIERCAAVFAGWSYVFIAATLGHNYWILPSGVILIPYIAGGLAFLKMSYTFNTLALAPTTSSSGAERYSFFGKPIDTAKEKSGKTALVSSVDIVIFAADQASNPAAIAPIMDDVRIITSRQNGGHALTKADEHKLSEVYMRIERYLIEQEPIRPFTAQKLRRLISDTFDLRGAAGSHTFWHNLPRA